MAKLFVEASNGYVHEITDTDFVDTYYDFDGMVVVDAPSKTVSQIQAACAVNSVTYIENYRLKTKIQNRDGKWYLMKKNPDWRMKYADAQLSSTYFDYPENLETEVA